MNGDAVWLTDSTLREGCQAAGFNPTVREKLRLAELLDDFGLDLIELGHPAAAPAVREFAVMAAPRMGTPTLVHCLLREADIEDAAGLGADWIGFFLCVRPELDGLKYGGRLGELVESVPRCVQRAQRLGLRVRFTCEDASRTPFETVLAFMPRLEDAGADLLGYSDTAGALIPSRAAEAFAALRRELPRARLHFHGHNDLGLATANALAAIEAGWDSVDASALGIGERSGIVPLTEMAALLNRERGRRFNLRLCHRLEQFVWNRLDMDRHRLRRHAHKSGIHLRAAAGNPSAYEEIVAEELGAPRLPVLSMHAGRGGAAALARKCGIEPTADEAAEVARRIKLDGLEICPPAEIKNYILRVLQSMKTGPEPVSR